MSIPQFTMSISNFLLRALAYSAAISEAVGAPSYPEHVRRQRPVCTVEAGGSNSTDDAPAIISAFEECGQGGRVVFENTTYFVNSVMEITGLDDCEIDLEGTLQWSTDIDYWLENSLEVGYQNQSTAWILGGNNVLFDGHGYGTLDGYGDVWYDFIDGASNYPGRPHAIAFSGLTNSEVRGLNFLRSQMWSVTIINSDHNLFDDIYVRNIGFDGSESSNTDGADTINSSFIHFNNWEVTGGDDSIALKANSSDITITNCLFKEGLGIAMGSIGQYEDIFETIERVTVDNIEYEGTSYAVYFKTWTGDRVGDPPNGGGGGLGYAADMNFTNLHGESFKSPPFSISQCTTFSGDGGEDCENSEFEIRDISVSGLTGSGKSTSAASIQCSAVAPCFDIEIKDVDLTNTEGGEAVEEYLCLNANDLQGFECTGEACAEPSSTGGCE